MSDDYADVLEQQRRAFEAQFGSLESMGFEDKTKHISAEPSDEENASEESFQGFSDKEEEEEDDDDDESDDEEQEDDEDIDDVKYTAPSVKRSAPKVIKFQDPSGTYEPPSKKEQKQLRSGRSLRDTPLQQNDKDSDNDDSDSDADTERQNMKNDVELQKFLQESHLLSAMDPSTEPNSQIYGKTRARALEMHLNHLSTTNGNAPKLEKVPMHVRKGMIRKHLHKIQRHEEEAKDAGIVLSKTKKGQFRKVGSTYKNDIERRIGTSIKSKEQKRKAHRQRGLKVQSVGKSTRHGLKISPKDIDRISKS